ncbi:hypothetical protein OC846_001173 [Tilletia horrida]|uniref:Uncharacterized protein n=1 Tax=Tilletia horrida TaxID=155126 RepID=A0AAN6GUI9_9BASI|nr:hypothetical protein OC846_001173 [Tilletia horrida]KAK0569406.1 hypothetical protein OC861_001012 [Tilletia horrida]
MDPVNADSSSFTWTALNADDSAMFGPSGGSEQGGTQANGSGNGGGSGNGMGVGGGGFGNGASSPMQIIPTVANTSAQLPHPVLPPRPLSSIASGLTTRVSSATPTAASSSASPAPSSTPAAKPTGPPASSSGLSPSALASVSSAVASLGAAAASSSSNSHNVSSSSPSGIFKSGSPNSLADSSAEGAVPLRHNPPLLLLLILGCLVGAATVIGSLAWLCRASDSRKRAKKKARLNQSSWDPDASSSVFDGAGSSVVGGAESSLLGGGAGAVRDGPPLMSGRNRGVSGATAGAGPHWWVLGDNDKHTASPSLMDHDFKSPNPYDHPVSRQSTWERDLAPHSQPALRPSDFSRSATSVDSGFMASNPHALASSLLFGQDASPGTPRNQQGGATYGRHDEQRPDYRAMSDDQHAGRAGTPVLSPLLKQILHPAPAFASGTVVRPGTPSSLLAGRPNHRTYAQI